MQPFLYVSLFLLAVWMLLLVFSRATRHEQWIMSVAGLVLAPGALMLASLDYRAGEAASGVIGVEDLIFAFALFGIAAVIYEVIFSKHLERVRGKWFVFPHRVVHWFVHLVLILGLWACGSLAFILVLGLTSVQGIIVGGLLVGIYIIADRKDLLFDALLSGLLVSLLVFLAEQLFFIRLYPDVAAAYWQTNHLAGLFLGGVPVEELVWCGVVGFTIGPLYEYLSELRLQ